MSGFGIGIGLFSPSGSGTGFPAVTPSQQPQTLLDMKNRIVNGDMRVDQANAGALLSISAAAFGFSVDKWKGFGVGAAGVFSLQRLAATPPAGFTNYLRATTTTLDAAPAAGSVYSLTHVVEGVNIQDLGFGLAVATSVTLSFWVRSSLTGNFGASLKNGATNRSYPFQFNIGVANAWQQVIVTVAVDNAGVWAVDNTAGVILTLDLGCGATTKGPANAWAGVNYNGVTGSVNLISTNAATFDLTGVQLEFGTGATSFEQLAYNDQLERCQREFWKTFNQATAPAPNVGATSGEFLFASQKAGALANYAHQAFPVVMRATPTITTYNPAAANAEVRDEGAANDGSGTGTYNITERAVTIQYTGNVAAGVLSLMGIHITANARL